MERGLLFDSLKFKSVRARKAPQVLIGKYIFTLKKEIFQSKGRT